MYIPSEPRHFTTNESTSCTICQSIYHVRRDHEWCIIHYPIIQLFNSNLYKNPTLPQLYEIIDKYNLSQIKALNRELCTRFETTGNPTVIETNSFPYVLLLLISNILDFLHTFDICPPPDKVPENQPLHLLRNYLSQPLHNQLHHLQPHPNENKY